MPLPDFPAGAQKFQKITMRYSEEWSDESKAGELVNKNDTVRVYFFILDRKTRVVQLKITDADENEIEWLDEAAGKIHIWINSEDTEDIAPGKKTYECWALLPNGAKALVDRGDFVLEASAAASMDFPSSSPSSSPSPSSPP